MHESMEAAANALSAYAREAFERQSPPLELPLRANGVTGPDASGGRVQFSEVEGECVYKSLPRIHASPVLGHAGAFGFMECTRGLS